MKLQTIISAIQEYLPHADTEPVMKAYAFVTKHHQGQTRASGEPYVAHVTEVAYLATKLRLDIPSITTALLHDTVEDTSATIQDITKDFGTEVAELVDGVTKLNQVKFSSRAEAQAENFRKMLLAMARDIRVLLLKLCDRLHNMRTLEFLSESRQVRIAQETLDIYAPLAGRLGIYWMKSELEDLSLLYLKPAVYQQLQEFVKSTKDERERYINRVVELINRELVANEIPAAVSGRPKHFYSIYEKMERHNMAYHEIHDITAFRIIVKNQRDCYGALGVMHAAWKPVPGRFKDYIAMPKRNGYQSLHTTVVGPSGNRIEIQIRTDEMHDIAERGIAAHWIYKHEDKHSSVSPKAQGNSSPGPLKAGEHFTWIRELLDSERLLADPVAFLSLVKEDLLPREVFVFSPKGDLYALHFGATPIDFAYHIHSEVGHHCIGARVNGQQVALATRLRNGDTVEITTSPHQTPSKDWLKFVTTSKAQQRIRNWIKNQERARAIEIGKELLAKDLRKMRISLPKVVKDGSLLVVAEALGFKELDLLFADVGYGKIQTTSVLRKLLPEEPSLEEKLNRGTSTALQKIFEKAKEKQKNSTAVRIQGLEDIIYRFARCCEPLPGDEILGFVTRGRGVVIHTRGCNQTHGYDSRRMIPVSWEENNKTTRQVRIKVSSLDRIGILSEITQIISAQGSNIVKAEIQSLADGKAVNDFEVTVTNSNQLEAIARAIEAIDGVLRVERSRHALIAPPRKR